jgi:hypothetical protein
MKNQLVKTGKREFKDVGDILRDPSQKAKLQNYIDEAVVCKTKILDQNQSIKTLRESARDEVGIEPKMFNALVSVFHNNNFDQKKQELVKLEDAIDAFMGTAKLSAPDEE